MMITKKDLSIYVHIPFCESKCIYCTFNSFCATKKKQKDYVCSLIDEIEKNKNKFSNHIVKTIYFGGGTPSILDKQYIKKILKSINNNYNIDKDAEISIECNPNSVDELKLSNYKKSGINRISFGAQSLNNKTLKLLGRVHDKKQIIDAIKLAKKVGFENISCDFLLGIPNQNKIIKELKTVIKLGVTHLSAYMLIVEESSKIKKLIDSGEILIPNDDQTVDIYKKAYKFLNKMGFKRYEVSNFAKENYECRHNLNYWNMNEYIGFGLSAHSFYNANRLENNQQIDDYLKGNYTLNKEQINLQQQLEEYILLGLRTKFGISINTLRKKYKYDILKLKSKELKRLKDNKFISILGDTIIVNENKFGVLNQIILDLI